MPDEVVQRFVADAGQYLATLDDMIAKAAEFAAANEAAAASARDIGGGGVGDAARLRDLAEAANDAASAEGDLRTRAAEAAVALDAQGAAAAGAAVATDAAAAAAGGGGLAAALSALAPELIAVGVALAAVGAVSLFPFLASLSLVAVGIGTFAAVAIPSLFKVWAAVSAGGAAWRKLSPAEKEAGDQIKSLKEEFADLTRAVQPMVLTAFTEALRIARDLMPALIPLAKAAGQALDTLLRNIAHWLDSGSGQKFIAWMQRDGPHAIETFGKVLWNVIQGVGRTFSFLYNLGETLDHWFGRVFGTDIPRWFDVARHTAASWADDVKRWVTGALDWIMARLKPFRDFWHQHWSEIETIAKVAWAVIVGVIKTAWGIIEPLLKAGLQGIRNIWVTVWTFIKNVTLTVWNVIKDIVAGAVHFILDVVGAALALLTGHWHQAWSDLVNATSAVLHTLVRVVVDTLVGLGKTVFDLGKNIVMGLINGMKSMIGGVIAAAESIGHAVLGALGGLLHILSPSRVTFWQGQMLGQGLIDGMASMHGAVAAAAAQMGSRAAFGVGAGLAYGGSGTTVHVGGITVNAPGGAAGLDRHGLQQAVQAAVLDHWTRNRGSGFTPYGFPVR